jgi:peptidyl-prolyl cis-trans isomerase SurA
MKKILINNLLVIFFLVFSFEKISANSNNSIIITVGNYPITRLDLIKEIKFIAVLSKIEIDENNKKKIKDLAVQTLVKRAIKEQEIDRLKITRYNKKDLDKQVVATAKNLGFNKEGLKVFLSAQNLSYEDLIKKYEIDLKWNTAIYELYKNKISLNTLEIEDKIKSELEKPKLDGKSILLSEIQVNLSSEGLDTTSKKVLLKIKELGFEGAAKNLSISSSAQVGGNLGWIKENKISANIFNKIKNLKNGEISNPIIVDDIVIFIKKIDEKEESVDLDTIKKNVVYSEKIKKLEMFSNAHYSDLERSTQVKFL